MFDLFFNPKGRLAPNLYFRLKLVVVIVLLLTLSSLSRKSTQILLGLPINTFIYMLWGISIYSGFVIDSKRLHDMGHSAAFALWPVVLSNLHFLRLESSYMVLSWFFLVLYWLFLFVNFAYYVWLVCTPSTPDPGEKDISPFSPEGIKKINEEMEKRRMEIGTDAFNKETLAAAEKALAKAKKLLETDSLDYRDKKILSALIKDAEKARDIILKEIDENEKGD